MKFLPLVLVLAGQAWFSGDEMNRDPAGNRYAIGSRSICRCTLLTQGNTCECSDPDQPTIPEVTKYIYHLRDGGTRVRQWVPEHDGVIEHWTTDVLRVETTEPVHFTVTSDGGNWRTYFYVTDGGIQR